MSKQPPVPAANQSPFPLEEPPHEAVAENETVAAVKAIRDAKARRTSDATQLGVGAAIGVGSAAIVAALLYWRGNRKEPGGKK